VLALWDTTQIIPELKSLFAVNALRQQAAHTPSTARDFEIGKSLKVFGIGVAAQAGGWGYAIDTLYDQLTADLNKISALLEF
jgi:hypothetical protein